VAAAVCQLPGARLALALLVRGSLRTASAGENSPAVAGARTLTSRWSRMPFASGWRCGIWYRLRSKTWNWATCCTSWLLMRPNWMLFLRGKGW
jgi:hypothetical protein